jgi:hypothetical protein
MKKEPKKIAETVLVFTRDKVRGLIAKVIKNESKKKDC